MGRKIAILRDLDLEVGHDPDPDHVGVQDPNPNQGLDQSQDPGQNLDLGPEDLDPDLAQNRHLKKLIVKPLDQDLAQSQKKMKKLMMQKPMMMVIMTKWC